MDKMNENNHNSVIRNQDFAHERKEVEVYKCWG